MGTHNTIRKIEPYQGARDRQVEVLCLDMGGSVVVDLISDPSTSHLTTCSQASNWLTAPERKKKACTETNLANKIEDSPLKSVKELEKSKLGNFDYAADVKSGLTLVHWHDNNIVNTVSNKVGVVPPQK